MKDGLREHAIKLRKSGKSYSEIRTVVPVAKSTLSLWFHSVRLAKHQKQRITRKRIEAARRGAASRKAKRQYEVALLRTFGSKAVGALTRREKWLIGTALYWAEGSKQNGRSPSAGLMFGNSDYRMLQVYCKWLEEIAVPSEEIYFELYVHEKRIGDTEMFREWWSEKLGISIAKIYKIYKKRGNPETRRSNVGDLYKGLIRIKVKSSTSLNRLVDGWIEGIHWGMV